MPISHQEALSIIASVASDQKILLDQNIQEIPILNSIGRLAAQDVTSLKSTPPFDTSAMDGFAVHSAATSSASDGTPVVFKAMGIMAAGEAPITLSPIPESGLVPCVEIMTGAQFPKSSTEGDFDACVPIEHTTEIIDEQNHWSCRKVTKPVRANQHRRLAGSDFREGDIVLRKGETVQSRHIMAMASLGISKVRVARSIQVGILSTGSELIPHDSDSQDANKIMDCNGPYLTAALSSSGIHANFIGNLEDDLERISSVIEDGCARFDVLVTTGAVSCGKFDYIRTAIENIGAQIRFHKVAIRPGHPVLFATIRQTAFFGLPGNPVAAAACLNFLVMPFVHHLRGVKAEAPIMARVVPNSSDSNYGNTSGGCSRKSNSEKILQSDLFRLGRLHRKSLNWAVEIGVDQSPGKVRPLVEANCWVHQPMGTGEPRDGQIVRCFQL